MRTLHEVAEDFGIACELIRDRCKSFAWLRDTESYEFAYDPGDDDERYYLISDIQNLVYEVIESRSPQKLRANV